MSIVGRTLGCVLAATDVCARLLDSREKGWGDSLLKSPKSGHDGPPLVFGSSRVQTSLFGLKSADSFFCKDFFAIDQYFRKAEEYKKEDETIRKSSDLKDVRLLETDFSDSKSSEKVIKSLSKGVFDNTVLVAEDAKIVKELVQIAPSVALVETRKEKMLSDLSERGCTEMRELFETLLSFYPEEIVSSWECSEKDGVFEMKLNRPIKWWVAKSEEEKEETEHGALLILGPEVSGRISKSEKKIEFDKNSFRMECAARAPFSYTKLNLYARYIWFVSSSNVQINAGMMMTFRTKIKTLDKLIKDCGTFANHRSPDFSYTRDNRGIEEMRATTFETGR